jgi:uncharacterized protein involved in exopolysaccharide biosynthesis
LGAVLCAVLLPKKYEGEIKILVNGERVDPVVTPEASDQPRVESGPTEEQMNTEVELITSRDLLGKVVTACELQRDHGSFWSFLSPDKRTGSGDESADASIARAVSTLEKKLVVEVLKRSDLISVTYRSSNPKLAACVLSSLSDFYLQKHLAVHRPSGTLDFFRRAKDQYRDGLNLAQQRLISFSRDQGVASPELEEQNALLKLAELDATLKQTRAKIAGTEQRIRIVESLSSNAAPRLTTQVRTSATLLEQLKSTLFTLQLKRTELLDKFQPSYPPLQELEKQITQTHAEIVTLENAPVREETTDVDPTYEWMRAELAKAKTDLADLRAQEAVQAQAVRAYQENARLLDQKGVVKQDLSRAVRVAEANYLLYGTKEEEARIADALDQKQISNVSIAEAATIPALPVHSAWWYLAIGLIAASVVSVGMGFAAEYFDTSFRTPDEVQDFLEIPVLGWVPKNAHDAEVFASSRTNGN